MEDTKHIRRDFHSVAWVMPQGSDLGALGVSRSFFFLKHCHVAYQIAGDNVHNRMQVKFSSYGQTGDLGVRSKGQISVISVTISISKIFIPNLICVLTNERYKTYHQTEFLFCRLSHAPEAGLRGAGDAQGINNLFFSDVVMWHIKSTGMTRRTECK